jgi:hypothetical protein
MVFESFIENCRCIQELILERMCPRDGFLFEAVFAVRTWPPPRRFDGNDLFLNGRENEPQTLHVNGSFLDIRFEIMIESESLFSGDLVGEIKIEAF